MKKYLNLLRVKHYIKNLLILFPLFFSGNILDIDKLISVVIGMVSFSLISSAVYIINDIKDINEDRLHPIKKNRAIASGAVSIKKAVIIAIVFLIISLSCTIAISIEMKLNIYLTMGYLILYLLLNLAYSFGLKDKPLIDIVILVSGFLLRILFGGAITQIEISSWLYLTVIFISFYLSLGKRRNELIRHKDKDTRMVLKNYTKEFLDKNMCVCMALAICSYALWAINYMKEIMICTIPIVMVLAMRYSFDIDNNDSEGDPVEVISKDKSLIILGLIDVIVTVAAIYF